MFNFITEQTDWYKTKTNELKSIRVKALNEYPVGKLKLELMRLDAIFKAKQIMNACFGLSYLVDPIKNKALVETQNAMNALINQILILQKQNVKAKEKDLQKLSEREIPLESRPMQGMCFQGGYKEQTAPTSFGHYRYERGRCSSEVEQIIEQGKVEKKLLETLEKIDRRKGSISGNMGGKGPYLH